MSSCYHEIYGRTLFIVNVMMEEFKLEQFDSYKEDNRREVKKAESGLPRSIWETYSSMCNTYGGVIICGVIEREDYSWKTCGLKDVSRLKKDLWNTLNNPSKVSINLLSEDNVREYEVNGDIVLVITVPRAPREIRPVYINDNLMRGTFKRNWEGDYHCTEREVKAMIRDQAVDSPDMKVLNNKKMKDLDSESIRSYRNRYNSRHDGTAWANLPDDQFLQMIGAASEETEDGKIHPTAAGLLMFGQEYLITREFPEYFLDYREKLDPSIRWTDRVQTQSGEWSGNVYDFFTKVYRKVTSDFKVPFMTEGAIRIEETPKHLAVREAIANCLVNTDFFQPWSVVIEKYPDRIEIANPGTIIPGKDQMLKGGISEPRNKTMLKIFNLIGVGERAGSGVPEIYEVWEKEGLDKPIVEEQFGANVPDRTKLILPLALSGKIPWGITQDITQEITQEIEVKILDLIGEKPSITGKEMADKLGIKEDAVKYRLNKLRSLGIIEHQGPTKAGVWVITK